MTDQVFTIGSGRNGTKSMAVILGTAFRKSFHEYKMIPQERRRIFFNQKWMGPKFKAKVRQYKKFRQFHDADNCNTYFIHHLGKIFPEAKILLPVGSAHSFIRAHRAWGILGANDSNMHSRAYPKDDKKWHDKPIVVKLAWLWGIRNTQAIKRSDKKRLMVFRTKDILKKLDQIFEFIEKPITDKAVSLASRRHNRLAWPPEKVAMVEAEIKKHLPEIERTIRPFKYFLSGWLK